MSETICVSHQLITAEDGGLGGPLSALVGGKAVRVLLRKFSSSPSAIAAVPPAMVGTTDDLGGA